MALLAFLRLSTRIGLFPRPLSEHAATVFSFDTDFDRFEGVRREAPG